MKKAPACATAKLRAFSLPSEGYNCIVVGFDPLA